MGPQQGLDELRRSLSRCDLMQCPICSMTFKDPIVLNNCSHRFCLVCIKDYINISGNQCPTCSRQFEEGEFVADKAFSLAIQLTELSANFDVPCSSNESTITSISKELINVVLWPDSSIYELNLPACVKRPRYIRVPLSTTVAHLTEFLYIRFEIEGNCVDLRNSYTIEFTNVLKERENIDRSYLPHSAKFAHQTNGSKEEPEFFPQTNLMLIIKYPFEALQADLDIQQLINDYMVDESRPLKLLFRLK